jgi:signal transduction histidine kinase
MESLSASKKKLSTILANASSLFITVDGKGCISYASRALGPTRPGDAIGTDAASWQAAENRSEFHAALDAVLLGRASATVESAGWGDDTRWYSNHIVAMPTNEHDAAALIIADEITGAKRIERTLVMTAQEVLGLSGSELFQALAKRLALSVNADIVFLDELEASKTRGRNLAAWIDGQAGEYPDYELAGTPGEAVLRIGLCCYSSDLRQAFPNARMLIGLGIDAYVGVPLWDEKREVIGLMAAGFRQPLKDPQLVESTLTCFSAGISAALSRQRTAHALRASESRRLEGERRSQQEIERLLAESNAANRLKDELLRNLTHEIRTPLAAIIGWSTIAADAPQHDHVIREALDKIQQNAEAELALVDDVIDLSLIFAGGLTVRREATDLSLILPSTINGLRAKAAELHVTLVTDLPNTPVELQGDPARMHQVVERILANAIEFSKPNGQVYIGLKATPDQARITIRDDGEGIAPEFMPHLFSGLRQENAGLNRTHRGLGVSLAIVRAIVTAHRGEITAYSGGKGFGATFVVSLPLKPTSLKAAAQKLTPRH